MLSFFYICPISALLLYLFDFSSFSILIYINTDVTCVVVLYVIKYK